ncbi:MAG TPA: hypothetical protein VGW33_10800 [Terriglobia bacterium]|nr:hypothetical protein [Terriglobia bacterium]
MRSKVLSTLFVAAALGLTATGAHAGALRYLGRKIKGGSNHAAQATVKDTKVVMTDAESAGRKTTGAMESAGDATKNAAESATDAVGNAATTTGSAVKAGATDTANGAKEAPHVAANGVSGAAKKVWHVIW